MLISENKGKPEGKGGIAIFRGHHFRDLSVVTIFSLSGGGGSILLGGCYFWKCTIVGRHRRRQS